MDALRLSQLTALIKEAVEGNFRTAYWIIAEISEIKLDRKNHCYLELVEKNEQDEFVAKIRANIWSYIYRKLSGKFQEATKETLKAGMKVLVLADVKFSDIYGLSLHIKDIDPTYSIGEMERKRREIIERLIKENLLDRNKKLELPLVPQRLAIISSPGAAGYDDFINHLTYNQYRYKFDCTLYPAILQGQEAEYSIVSAFKQVAADQKQHDAVIILRGGGGVADLSFFDSYKIAVEIANIGIPCFTGIGHHKDETITDMVSHSKFKTPTAVAEFIISGVRTFDERLIESGRRLKYITEHIIKDHKHGLAAKINNLVHLTTHLLVNISRRLHMILSQMTTASYRTIEKQKANKDGIVHKLSSSTAMFFSRKEQSISLILSVIKYKPPHILTGLQGDIDKIYLNLKNTAQSLLTGNKNKIQNINQAVRLLDPVNVIKRGYSVTLLNGKVVKSIQQAKEGDHIETRVIDGLLKSKVYEKKGEIPHE